MKHLTLDAVVIPNAFSTGVERFTRLQIYPDDVAFGLFILNGKRKQSNVGNGHIINLESHNGILNVKSSVGCKSLWNDEKCICVRLYAKLCAALCCLLDSRRKMICASNFERACTRNEALIFDGVLHASKPITKRVVNLCNCVLVRT